jgi:hypothetical protein
MITYSWNILNLKTKDINSYTKFVIAVIWQKIGTDENNTEGKFDGVTQFSDDEKLGSTFIPFDSLTQETVVSWIQNKIAGLQESDINKEIKRQIERPVITNNSPPWVNNN